MSENRQKSKTVQKVQDRRVERTCQSIDDAFFQLLQRKSYDSISVSDVVRKANVGRATFYVHYQKKDDLFKFQLDRVASCLIVAQPSAPWLLDATPLFAHVRDVRPLLRALISPTSGTRVTRMLQDSVENRIVEIMAQGKRAAAGSSHGVPLNDIGRCGPRGPDGGDGCSNRRFNGNVHSVLLSRWRRSGCCGEFI